MINKLKLNKSKVVANIDEFITLNNKLYGEDGLFIYKEKRNGKKNSIECMTANETVFLNVDFTDSNINQSDFTDCIFINCDFSCVKIKSSSFINCNFIDCDFLCLELSYSMIRGCVFCGNEDLLYVGTSNAISNTLYVSYSDNKAVVKGFGGQHEF